MAFATDIYKSTDSNHGKLTYNFNKSINQYFASGYVTNALSAEPFNCAYNNGTAFGWGYFYRNNNIVFNIDCSANSIAFGNHGYYGDNLRFYAVVIYPAKYGDVTIS